MLILFLRKGDIWYQWNLVGRMRLEAKAARQEQRWLKWSRAAQSKCYANDQLIGYGDGTGVESTAKSSCSKVYMLTLFAILPKHIYWTSLVDFFLNVRSYPSQVGTHFQLDVCGVHWASSWDDMAELLPYGALPSTSESICKQKYRETQKISRRYLFTSRAAERVAYPVGGRWPTSWADGCLRCRRSLYPRMRISFFNFYKFSRDLL